MAEWINFLNGKPGCFGVCSTPQNNFLHRINRRTICSPHGIGVHIVITRDENAGWTMSFYRQLENAHQHSIVYYSPLGNMDPENRFHPCNYADENDVPELYAYDIDYVDEYITQRVDVMREARLSGVRI